VEWRSALLASGAEQSRGLCSCRRRGRQAGRRGGGTEGASGRRWPDEFFTSLASSKVEHMAGTGKETEGGKREMTGVPYLFFKNKRIVGCSNGLKIFLDLASVQFFFLKHVFQ